MKGFTLLETLVVVAIIGILTISSWPMVMNTLETRQLDNSAREVISVMEMARFKALDAKLDYRVRFDQENGVWYILLEQEVSSGTWSAVPGYVTRFIPTKFTVTLNIPSTQTVQFSAVGLVDNYSSTQNTVTIKSTKLKANGQPDLRLIQIFGGGSIRFSRSSS